MRDNELSKEFSRRMALLLGGKISFMALLLGRMSYLQLFKAGKYKKLSDENMIRVKILPPTRGIIYDRNEKVLAGNKDNYSIQFYYDEFRDAKRLSLNNLLNNLNKVIPLDGEDIERIKKDISKRRKFIPIMIKDRLTWKQMSKINFKNLEYPGVFVESGKLRHYPYMHSTSHFVGYVANVSKEELEYEKNPLLFLPDFRIGKEGVEKKFEDTLRGKKGELKQIIDSSGKIIDTLEKDKINPIPGKAFNSSIDIRLQNYAMEVLEEESAAVTVMDIYNGEVLALASTPSFDPNNFVLGFESKDYAKLLADPKKPFMNKVIEGVYSPGSTFKPIVAIAALEAGEINRNTKFYCKGYFDYANHRYHCWKATGHGSESVVEALQHSCDVFFYETSLKVGIDDMKEMAERFGLGQKTGIELPDEKMGRVPDKEWKRKYIKQDWLHGDSILTSIGQGYLTSTPIELAVLASRIANGGIAVEPTLIKDNYKSKSFAKMDIDPKYLKLVHEGLNRAVNYKKGTAYWTRFNYKNQKMAGKTGTTQVFRISKKEREQGIRNQKDLPWKLRNHALFFAYAPVNNPKYAISVVIEHGMSGSLTAAPIASKILKKTLELNT
jgi:penicillin-binding protein 2